MSEHIATLGQLLDGAGTQWRAFDIGRHITKLDKQQFLAVEQALCETSPAKKSTGTHLPSFSWVESSPRIID